MFLICLWWEEAAEGALEGSAAGNMHRRGESWLQQLPLGVERECKGWDLGLGAGGDMFICSAVFCPGA